MPDIRPRPRCANFFQAPVEEYRASTFYIVHLFKFGPGRYAVNSKAFHRLWKNICNMSKVKLFFQNDLKLARRENEMKYIHINIDIEFYSWLIYDYTLAFASLLKLPLKQFVFT